jgi:hypothetical protein
MGRQSPAFWRQFAGIVDRHVSVSVVMKRASDFELPDHEGKAWRLSDQLARGPILLVFYRGDW